MQQEVPFPCISPGYFVIVGDKESGHWWMAQVVVCSGSASNTKNPSHLLVTDVDSGLTRWIKIDEVSDVMWSMDGWPSTTLLTRYGDIEMR